MPAALRTRRETRTPDGARADRLEELQGAMATLTASRQELAAALDAASHYARAMMDACLDPMIAVSPDGLIQDINEAAVRLTGIVRETMMGSDFSGYFTDPDRARAAAQQSCARGFLVDYPLVVRHRSGELTDVVCSARAYCPQGDRPTGAFLIARSATGEREREAELARLHAQLDADRAELGRRESELAHIRKLYEVLQTCNASQEAYAAIASAAADLFPGSWGALATTVEGKSELETVADWGQGPAMLAGFSLNDCWALRRGQLREMAKPGTPLECRHFRSVPGAGYACLPLSVRAELQGLMILSPAGGGRLSDPQRQLFATLGDVVKLSLSNLKLREVLRAQSIKDPVTGLFNRHYLEETLPRELALSRRRGTPMCVTLLDIDGFKEYNDRHGHDAGDAVLRAVGKFLRARLRSSDIACRSGGDEFVIVLLDTAIDQVRPRIEQLRSEIRQIDLGYEGGELPPLSVSIGVAQWPDHTASMEELIRNADRGLYAAKAGGRDCIVMYSPKTQVHPRRSS